MTDHIFYRILFITGLLISAGFVLLTDSEPDNQDDSPVNWGEKQEITSGAAHQGPWLMNDSDFRYVDDPTLAFDQHGNLGIVWVDQSEQDLYFQKINSAGEPQFSEPVAVLGDSDIFSWLPRMVIDSEGIYLLWQEIIFSGGSHGGEILFSRSTNGGKTFSDPINLSNTEAGAGKGRLTAFRWDNGSLDLAISPEGKLYAAWTEYEGALYVSRSTDRGQTFSEPVRIAGTDSEPARGPDLAVDPDGTVHIVWTIGEDVAADIRYAYSTDGGNSFSKPEIVFESGTHSDAPKLASDSNGNLHLVFANLLSPASRQYTIQYTRRFADETSFEEPKQISGNHSGQVRSTEFPELALDEKNRLFVIWDLFPSHTGRSLGLGFSMSEDGGDNFSIPSPIPGTTSPGLGANGSRQGSLMRKLAAKGDGEIAIVTSTFREGQSSHIWLIRGVVK
ncbi:MAG: sialidase family protein [Balneolaceae bacterium]